ncbi:MAG TPA: OstA-like protein, partial [Rubricoccaceae bacterium]|nr:OstA-like protein [Rubricoccaceae bacterium]
MAAGLPPARAQTRVVTLINADSVVVEGDSTGTVRRLFGNVAFRQDTTALYAGSAVQYVERGEIVLDGGVRITNGDDTLTARRVTYDANAKEALAVGNVRITDGETVLLVPSGRYFSRTRLATFDVGGRLLHDVSELTAPSGTYDAEAKVATFSGPVTLRDTAVVVTASSGRYEVRPKVAFLEGPVTLRDSVAVLTSQSGVYDVDAERADFLGEVRLVRRAARLEADTLTYFRQTEIADAAGRVVLARYGDDEEAGRDAPTDSSRLTLLFADRIHHDDPNRLSTAEGGEPLAVVLTTDSTGTVDTLMVRALSFEARRPEREDGRGALRLDARDSVRVVHPRFAAAADSAAFTRLDAPEGSDDAPADTLRLFGSPSTWFDEAQVTGDTLVVAARGEAVEGIEVVGRAFTAQLDTMLGRVNQLRGRRMVGVFAADDLRRLS